MSTLQISQVNSAMIFSAPLRGGSSRPHQQCKAESFHSAGQGRLIGSNSLASRSHSGRLVGLETRAQAARDLLQERRDSNFQASTSQSSPEPEIPLSQMPWTPVDICHTVTLPAEVCLRHHPPHAHFSKYLRSASSYPIARFHAQQNVLCCKALGVSSCVQC